jgi:DNA-nicking Smr family endonuclease
MASDKRNKDDAELFREQLGDARPVKQDRVPPHRKKRKPIPEQSQRDAAAVMQSTLSDDYDPADIETGEELLHARPGLQHTVMRKLRRGQYAIEAELDLHGRTVPQAREALDIFLRNSRAMGKRCVRVIHGKGKTSEGKLPVLKGKVNNWLRQKDEVLAFCTAIPRDGGGGAVYVLLRRG